MTTFAPSAAPPHSLKIWIDRTPGGPRFSGAIYVEYPVKDGPPFIQAYPLDQSGLGCALASMIENWQANHPVPAISSKAASPAKHPLVKEAKPRPGTEAQRANTHALLKKLGLI